MPTWLLISLALLLGACHDPIVGGIRQLNTNPNPTIMSSADNGDVWISEEIHSDTVVVTDTTELDTTLEVDTRDVIDTAEAVDTITPDTVPETIEDIGQEVVDTTAPETIQDTAQPPDTTTEVDTTPPECEEDLDCKDSDDCTLDYCENFSCVHEDDIACVTDSDNDGIVDIEDDCPIYPEFYDFYEDEDGCPEEDQDHDGWTALEGDCENNPSSGQDPASFCWNEVDGFHLMIHFGVGADQRPTCDYYNEDGELIEGFLLFETNGVFLIGPQIDGCDTPGNQADEDCDGEINDPGEDGLSPPYCYWGSFPDGSEVVWCWWMDELYEL